jgi:membrane protease YdiL (CAAX protease family)
MEYLNNEIPESKWDYSDILSVLLIIIVFSASSSFGMLSIFGDSKVASIMSRYLIALSAIFVPMIWLKSRYKLSKDSLGLRKPILTKWYYLLIPIFSGLYYTIISSLWPNEFISLSGKLSHNFSYLDIILLPLSIYSFATIVLSPISEEILWRGFMYGYFRKKLGIIFGLFLQAIMFALLHYNINSNTFTNIITISNVIIIALIAGFMYEKTGSIYPSMLFHCSLNYFSVVNIALHK